MQRLLAILVLVTMTLAATGAGADPGGKSGEVVHERAYDAAGRLVWERGLVADEEGIGFERFYRHADHARPDNPGGGNGGGNGGGKGGGGDGGGGGSGTDCSSDRFVDAGWRWSAPYSAYASSYASTFDAAGNTWDDATSADIFGGVSPGSLGVAGTYDGVNQIDFVSLGTSSTIAVTTTWYYTSTGEAVESDGQYNADYAWATDGSSGAMDVENIGAHEIGHTFGLDHPNGPAHKIGCLTMYAYGDLGETQKRTLGDGDILGIQALYGA